MGGFGKSIRLFLIEGTPNGRWVCELSNWTGKAYKIPRTFVKNCDDRDDLKSTGIYFLFGKNDEDDKDIVYIGEAENVLERLKQHLPNKEFWTESIVFISKDDNLNKAHIKYLENRIYSIAKEVNRYKLDNSSIPATALISEGDRAEMEEYIENAKLLLNTLGHKVLEPIITYAENDDSEIFYVRAPRGAAARGKPVSDGFAVIAGSKIATDTVKSMSKSLVSHRKKCIDTGIVDEGFTFTNDKVFTSPSLAAAVVMGRNANGRVEWKTKDGMTLKDFESKH